MLYMQSYYLVVVTVFRQRRKRDRSRLSNSAVRFCMGEFVDGYLCRTSIMETSACAAREFTTLIVCHLCCYGK